MRIELHVDFSCPYAYLASTRIEAIAVATGAELRWCPMLLGGVFRAVGTPDRMSEGMPAAKARHNALDMMRWAELFEVPLSIPAGHPIRTVRALRALLASPEPAWPRLIHAIYRAYWVDGIDVASADGLARALAAGGLDPAAIAHALAANDDPAIKDALRRRTDAAIGRGVFGAPTAFVDAGEDGGDALMFWGQDRLPMIEAAARGWRPGRPAPRAVDARGDRSTKPAPRAVDARGDRSTKPAPRAVDARGDRSTKPAPPDVPLLPPPAASAPAATAGTPAPTIDFYFDVSSPFAYLGSTQIERIARAAGARLRWRPILLGGLFRSIGTPDVPMLAVGPARQRYNAAELSYWSSWWGVPFRFQSRFPLRSVRPLRLLLAAGDRLVPLAHALFRAAWVDDRDLDDEATLRELIAGVGLAPDALLARTQEPALKQALIDATAAAAARGVFGAPTAVVNHGDGREHLFWGQDRLELAGRCAAGWRPIAG